MTNRLEITYVLPLYIMQIYLAKLQYHISPTWNSPEMSDVLNYLFGGTQNSWKKRSAWSAMGWKTLEAGDWLNMEPENFRPF